MGNVMELLYDLLVKPRAAMEEIVESATLSQAGILVLCTSALTTLAAFAGINFEGALLVLTVVFLVVKWGMMTAFWHLLAELLGGNGSVKHLLIATGFANFIEILVIPVYLADHFLQSSAMGLTAFAGLVIVVWSCFLQVFAIRATYRVSGARAALIFFLPILLLLFLCIIFAVGLYSMGASAMQNVFTNPPQF